MANSLVDQLAAIVGRNYVVAEGEDQEPYIVDWRGRYHGRSVAVVKPASTAEVSAVMKLCHAQGIPVVPQGGNTGMCGAATPDGSGRAVVIRLDRLNKVRAVSALANSMTVEAGCILADVQKAAEEVDRLFPLSLGAEGSCMIGGNIATNAGGTAVLRYGPTRELVLGLEVVLPDGTVLDRLRRLRKDASGYDLKQLFIGAEGTLGIITAAAVKMFPRPRTSAMAMVALPDIDAVLTVLGRLRGTVGDRLSSLEAMSRGQIEVIAENVPDVAIPFALESPWYLIIELTDTFAATDLRTPLEEVLGEALEEGLLTDAIIPESVAQAEALWRIRHSVSEGSKRAGHVVSHDSVVPLENQADFARNVEARIAEVAPAARIVMHGHIGDGNIHVLAILDRDTPDIPALAARINEVVDDVTASLGGVISAEHGIGITNVGRLGRVSSAADLSLMRGLKALLDPNNLMNPGKVLPPA
ncbi:FAD-binding oxidoreductase [Rhodovarius crocodyli]|uniref:FAD-binding oxidoreductase n=1 Tax=Rhodovarius crocodyli TaxID=1979269 RepID=A0A437MCM1_9PROT|nr:FAD-binding oxidoreductase [Rhodovarius crocodyli]RVT95365.1 FAD-binding oxidoreductase [Rhodovarius crocodyli]